MAMNDAGMTNGEDSSFDAAAMQSRIAAILAPLTLGLSVIA